MAAESLATAVATRRDPPSHPGETPRWSGVHHLALVTTDMDATVRFWHGVLGARLVLTLGTPQFRHYFFDVGPSMTVAFFEYADVALDTYAKPAGVPDPAASQFDHLSLRLPDESALESLRDRLKAHGCDVTEVVDHDAIRSIYFTDPNGIALEASWWTRDPTGLPDGHPDQPLDDPDPVAAVRELRDGGALSWTPATRLVGGIERPVRPL